MEWCFLHAILLIEHFSCTPWRNTDHERIDCFAPCMLQGSSPLYGPLICYQITQQTLPPLKKIQTLYEQIEYIYDDHILFPPPLRFKGPAINSALNSLKA